MGWETWIGVVALAAAAGALVTPLACRIAERAGMLDQPSGWKSHARATPYLGGTAVVAGLSTAAVAFGPDRLDLLAILGGAVLLLAVGIVDDRVRLHAMPRVLAELAAAALLWKTGLGWDLGVPGVVNLALTALWVVGVINAINLLDLMDGVTAAVVAVCATGCAALAAAAGDDQLTVLGLAVAGACLGFLPFNLSSPPKIFLGDGGTMPLGFILAALSMVAVSDQAGSAAALPAAACLLGVPLLDMGFRVVLRLSRGFSLMTAGPDSLANRLQDLLGSPRRVTLVLAVVQGSASALTVEAVQRSTSAVLTLFGFAVLGGATAAIGLQLSGRAPDLAAVESELPLVARHD